MQNYFNEIADVLKSLVGDNLTYTAYLSGEESDFVRFNSWHLMN